MIRSSEQKEARNYKLRVQYSTNPEPFKQRSLRAYYNNRDKVLSKQKARRETDPDHRSKLLAACRAYRAKIKAHDPLRLKLKVAKERAKKLHLGYDLTIAWAKDTYTGRCALTGLSFQLTPEGSRGPSMFAASIDRVDSTVGYVKSNCRWVLYAINSFKNSASDATMYEIAEALLRNRKDKNG